MTAGFGDEALEAARRGLDLDPCMPSALIIEGYLRNLPGHPPEESIELVERAMRLSPDDPAEFLFLRMNRAPVSTGQTEAAVRCYAWRVSPVSAHSDL